MNKDFIRMQMLAGVITESQYKQLLEDMEVIDRILDKISAQGKDSLSDEEKEYLDRYSKGDKDLKPPTSGATEVYVGEPYSGLYKIKNLPALGRPKDITFNCEDTEDASKCEEYPEYKALISNPKFKLIIDKIHSNERTLYRDPESALFFHGIGFNGDFSSPTSEAYAQVSGDGFLYIVDSMDQWSGKYQTQEGWGITDWKKI